MKGQRGSRAGENTGNNSVIIDEKSYGYWCPRAVDSDNMSAMTLITLILYIFNCLYGDGDIFKILCL